VEVVSRLGSLAGCHQGANDRINVDVDFQRQFRVALMQGEGQRRTL